MENLVPKNWSFASTTLVGKDAFDFAQRIFSANLKNLGEGEGKPSTLLTAEGKVAAFFWVFRTSERIDLLTPSPLQETLFSLIEKYHFSESFQVLKSKNAFATSWEDASGAFETEEEGRAEILEDGRVRIYFRHTFLTIDPKHPASGDGVSEDWEHHRITHLIPEWGKDFGPESLVFDIGFERFCANDKGCYTGQEVVERLRTRANSEGPKRLGLVRFEGKVEAKEKIFDTAAQPVGELTPSVISEEQKTLALAYLKKGFGRNHETIKSEKSERLGQVLQLCI